MKKFLCLFSAIIALFTIFVLSSCDENTASGSTFVLDRTNMQMSVGDVYTVSWAVIPAPEEETSVDWKSSDEAVVTCDGGVICAVGKGRAIVTATHSSGMYEVISVTVENEGKRLYMLEGESFQLENTDMDMVLSNAACVSSDTDIATVSKNDDGALITANESGKCYIRLERANASVAYYSLIVLSKETSGVNVKTDEFPLTVNYDAGRYQSAVKITNITVNKDTAREFLDDHTVYVEVAYELEKIYDSEGDDAINPTEFMLVIYSDESEDGAPLKEISVQTDWLAVSSGEKKSFSYLFYADFEIGNGQERSYTFAIKEIKVKE